MIELRHIWIDRASVDALGLDWLVPVLRVAGLRPLHELRKFQRAATAHEAVAAFAAGGEFRCLPQPLLHRPGRDRAVADEESPERTVIEFDQRSGSILDRKATLTVRGDRLYGD